MIEIEGLDMWSVHALGYTVCVTTNGTWNERNGRAVMGGGTAYDAATRFPDLPHKLAARLKRSGNVLYYFPEYRLITFPTKESVYEPSKLDTIERSSHRLIKLLDSHPDLTTVYLPRPGAGLGGLNYQNQVRPLIEGILDDRVVVLGFEPNKSSISSPDIGNEAKV